MGWDLIGDIHGEVVQLELLLRQLGYSVQDGVYRHPTRKVIFVGDLVDRGKDVKKVLGIVKAMVDAGTALAIIGNHEFNLVSYFTKNEAGAWLRPHTDRNYKQLESTLNDFKNEQELLEYYIEWIKTLPLFIEMDDFRVIHASWNDDSVGYLKEHYPENRLTYSLLVESNIKGSKAYDVIEFLLKGLEIQLDGFSFFDSENIERSAVRVQWWQSPKGKMLSELLVKPNAAIEDLLVPQHKYSEFCGYSKSAKPLFLGHYCIGGEMRLQLHNLVILDYCVYKSKRLTAYRFDGETSLDLAKMTQI